jgi:ATP-binding cassette, subfamily B, multidrug efflux pump
MSQQQSDWQKQKAIQRSRPMRGPGGHRSFEKPKNASKTLRRLLGTLSDQRWLMIFGIFLIILSSVTRIVATYYLKPVVNGLVDGFNVTQIIFTLVQMAAIYLISVVSNYLGNRFMIQVAQGTTHRIRKHLFHKMQALPIAYFDRKSHGELMSRFTNDVDTINIALEQSLAHMVTSAITIVGTFIMMLVLSPILTSLVVGMLIIMAFIIRFIGKRSAQNFRHQQKNLGELNGYIEEMMEGQKVVKVFNYEKTSKARFHERNENLRVSATRAQTYASILMPIMGNLSYMNYALTAMIGAMLAIRSLIDIGSIAVFLQYTRSFSHPITQIANQFNALLAALAGAERIFELQDEEPETDKGPVRLTQAVRKKDGKLARLDEEHAESDPVVWAWDLSQAEVQGSPDLVELKGEVRFEHVVFGYEPEQEVLHGVSLYAKPGQKIAFVGSTGAGKTTITNLINRFYEIRSGRITYDGIDIRQINKQDLRRTLGMVLQDVHLFQGTIRDNIRYGKLDASDEEIIEAAKIANAHGFISRLPNGYDTWLEPDGGNLSQGQRQLLSIARAAVANPPVLILDEATSSVDTRTERLIEQGMDRLMHGRTTFAIAHRLSTVRHANAIMVLENGTIIERGDHDDLLSLQGRYYRLCTGLSELE